MPLNVFQLRESVVREYADYVNSFVNIHDDKVRRFVEKCLDEGDLWPDPALQLNPASNRRRPWASLGQAASFAKRPPPSSVTAYGCTATSGTRSTPLSAGTTMW